MKITPEKLLEEMHQVDHVETLKGTYWNELAARLGVSEDDICNCMAKTDAWFWFQNAEKTNER